MMVGRRHCALPQPQLVKVAGDQTRITRFYSGKPMRVLANRYVEERERGSVEG